MEKKLLFQTNFADESCMKDFFKDGEGEAYIEGGRLIIDDLQPDRKRGLTVWLDQEFSGDIYMKYTAKTLPPYDANNINTFFVSRNKDDSEIKPGQYKGGYNEYHEGSNLYIVTSTGAIAGVETGEGWTRMRKDPGFNLISEIMGRGTETGKETTLEFLKKGNQIEVKIDGDTVHNVTDPDAYTTGKFGFRTWRTKLEVTSLSIYAVK